MIESLIYDRLKEAVRRKGYVWFGPRAYDMNLIGIRSPNTKPDDFDDWLCMAYIDINGRKRVFMCPATTDPGLYYLKNPINAKGAAIMKPGQYRGAYVPGLHRGYNAIVQVGKITVIRDYNKDGKLDFKSGREETGSTFGANIHRTLEDGFVKTIQTFSAGCQVVQSSDDFLYLLALANRQRKHIGASTFTYTLLEEKDIK